MDGWKIKEHKRFPLREVIWRGIVKGAVDQEWVEQWYSDVTNGCNHQENTISAFPLKNEGTV